MVKINGFNNEKYLEEQTQLILERANKFDNKLYLEFGGKLIYDYHASRVLPGYDPNVKMRLLQKLKKDIDIILCIYAGDIEKGKIRADFGITYDADALRIIDNLKEWDLKVTAVVITRYTGQPAAKKFKDKLERHNIKVYTHSYTKGYPSDLDLIISDEGYGANPYIETTHPIVVVTGPGPGSGKLATCLSQFYHDHQNDVKSGYAKFETFPIWSIPLKHPVNLAYEAATADLLDVNLIDPFHLEAYGEVSINYNRDVDAFPLLKKILNRIQGEDIMYKSPTDMGVNRVGFGITNDDAVKEASKQEIIRRFFKGSCDYALGLLEKKSVDKLSLLMEELNLNVEDRNIVFPARKAAEECLEKKKGHEGIYCGAAIELKDGSIVTGKNSDIFHVASSVILNAIKVLAGIPDEVHLLSPKVLKSISSLKSNVIGSKSVSLNLEETLIALSISATSDSNSQAAMEKLKDLRNCEMHMTHMATPGDESGLRKLGINITSDPVFSSRELFVE
jgi:uncharacterized protein (UPF0371 family)